MNSQELRKQLHDLIDQIDDAKLSVILNDLKDDLEIVGYRASGKVVTMGEINRAGHKIIENPEDVKSYSISESRKKLGLE